MYVLLRVANEGYVPAGTQYFQRWQDDDPAHIILAHWETVQNLPKDPGNRDYGEYTKIIVTLVQAFNVQVAMRRVTEEQQKFIEATEKQQELPKTDRFDVKHITSINMELESCTEKDETVKGLATRELDLSEPEVEEMEVRGQNSRLMAEELQKQRPELASAV